MLPRGDSAAGENLTFAQYSVKILKYIFNILYFFMLIRDLLSCFNEGFWEESAEANVWTGWM